jgi:CheY-like chemotaxis protein
VLVVEDDSSVREMMATLLTMEGYEATTAENGQAALDQLHTGYKPHVILLDLMMPVMDGFAFRDEQQHDPNLADIPVIVLTAVPPSVARVVADVVLSKPINFDQLLAEVRARC